MFARAMAACAESSVHDQIAAEGAGVLAAASTIAQAPRACMTAPW
jgi:hypothetical protein